MKYIPENLDYRTLLTMILIFYMIILDFHLIVIIVKWIMLKVIDYYAKCHK